MEDEVILAKPARVGVLHDLGNAAQLLSNDRLYAGSKIHIPDPAAGEVHKAFPVAREGKLIENADDAVIVILDFAFQTLAGFEYERIEAARDGRALVADVGGRRVLEVGLAEGARFILLFKSLLKHVEAQLFADIKLDEYKDG